jgi:hypothetical protein
MTKDDVTRMAREAGLGAILTHQGGEPRVWIEGADWHDEVERFAALVAAIAAHEEMQRNGYRQCAVGQRTTQFCGMLEVVRKEKREACAKIVGENFDKIFAALRELQHAANTILYTGEFATWLNAQSMPWAAAKDIAELERALCTTLGAIASTTGKTA